MNMNTNFPGLPLSLLLCGLTGLLASTAGATDIAGQWRAEFDTQIGMQKYVFNFQTDGDKLTGKAAVEVNGEKREAELKEGRINGDTVKFVEMLNIQDNEVRIQYTGKIGANEIAFTREVGDFAREEFKATRGAARGHKCRPGRFAAGSAGRFQPAHRARPG